MDCVSSHALHVSRPENMGYTERPVEHGLSFQARLQDKPNARFPMLYTTSMEQQLYWPERQVEQRTCLWQDYGIGNRLRSQWDTDCLCRQDYRINRLCDFPRSTLHQWSSNDYDTGLRGKWNRERVYGKTTG